MIEKIKPIFMLSDSRLLFHSDDDGPFLNHVRKQIESPDPLAAYIGASNGDVVEFYEMFEAAMAGIGIVRTKMITSTPSDEEMSFLKAADLILLAGGDAKKGWDVFKQNGFDEIIRKRYEQGAVLMGVSAGAIQLGKRTWSGEEPTEDNLFPTLKLVPLVLSVHEEGDWPNLRKLVELSGENTQGVGIPRGAGIIYHSDHSLQPVRSPAHSFWYQEGELKESVLMPPAKFEADDPAFLPQPEIIDTRLEN